MKSSYFKRRLACAAITFMVPILFFGLVSIAVSNRIINTSLRANTLNQITQSKDSIELILDEMDLMVVNFSASPELTTYLKDFQRGRITTSEALTTKNLIRIFISTPVYVKPYMYSIYVYYDVQDSKFILTSEGLVSLAHFYDSGALVPFLEKSKDYPITTQRRAIEKNGYTHKAVDVISVCYRVMRDEIIVLNMKAGYLEDMLKNGAIHEGQLVYVLNEKNEILLGSESEEIDEQSLIRIAESKNESETITLGEEKYFCTGITSAQYGWKFISMIPEKAVYRSSANLATLLLGMLLIALVASLAIAYVSTRSNTAHIMEISEIIKCAEEDRPLPAVRKINGKEDEYSQVTQKLIKAFLEKKYLQTRISEHAYRLHTMELIALQAQMNPHFVLNTLKSIYWMSVRQTGKPNDMSKMIENLADILSYSLQEPRRLVTFADELRNAHSYVEIVELRYKDKIHVTWDVDENVLPCVTIKVLLQPMIENAVYHGIKQAGSGTIAISLKREEDSVRVTIRDDGIGMEESQFLKMQEKLKAFVSDDKHIGLFNTNKRLAITFGDKASVSVDSAKGAGFTVIIVTPALHADEAGMINGSSFHLNELISQNEEEKE